MNSAIKFKGVYAKPMYSLHQALKTFSFAIIIVALAPPLSAQTPAVFTASDAPQQKPNIIVILADDHGWGSLGCYGGPAELKTPHLDRLAREGRRFTNAYAPSSVCSPTRYGLMTGRYDWRTRGDGGKVIVASAPSQIESTRLTLASLCKAQGYRTAVFGKWHLGIGDPPETDWNKPLAPGPRSIGFDYFYGIAATPGPPIREHVIMHAANGTYAIRMGDWKLVERKPPRQNELYNLKEDVAESKDVVASNADLAAQMQKLLSEARDRGYTRPNAGK